MLLRARLGLSVSVPSGWLYTCCVRPVLLAPVGRRASWPSLNNTAAQERLSAHQYAVPAELTTEIHAAGTDIRGAGPAGARGGEHSAYRRHHPHPSTLNCRARCCYRSVLPCSGTDHACYHVGSGNVNDAGKQSIAGRAQKIVGQSPSHVLMQQACLRRHNARKRVDALRRDRVAKAPKPPADPAAGSRQVAHTSEPERPHGYLRSMLPFSRFGPRVGKQGYFAF